MSELMSRATWLKKSAILLTVGLSSLLGALSCGEAQSEDVFYVYVVNGYAGKGALSIYSTGGPLATNLQFGQVSERIPVDRNRFDGTLQIITEGAPSLATLALDSYAFYPGETVTLFMTRRSGVNEYNLRVLRHHLLADDGADSGVTYEVAFNCALQVYNGLSLSNTYSPNSFDIQLQFQLPAGAPGRVDSRLGIYNPTAESGLLTPCGPVNLNMLANSNTLSDARKAALNTVIRLRTEQHTLIERDSWFYLVRGVELDNPDALVFRWGVWRAASGGDVIEGIRSTQEYLECLTNAVQVPIQPNTNGSIVCPTSLLDEVTVDEVSLQECLRRVPFTGEVLRPDNEVGTYYFYKTPSSTECNRSVRLRTRNFEQVFDVPGGVGASSLSQFQITFKPFTWNYYVIFGTPFSPLVYELNAEQTREPYSRIINPSVSAPLAPPPGQAPAPTNP